MDIKKFFNIKSWKISKRLSLSVGAVTIIGSLALYLTTITYVTSIVRDKAVNQMLDGAQDRAEIIESFVTDCETFMTDFSKSPVVKNTLVNRDDESAFELAKSYTNIAASIKGNLEGLYIADYDSVCLVHSSNPDFMGRAIREGDRLKQLQNDILSKQELTDIGILKSPASGQMAVSMYAPIYDSGKCVGFVGGGIFSEDIMRGLDKIPVEGMPNSKYYLVHTTDHTYLHADDDALEGTEFDDKSLLEVCKLVKGGSEQGSVQLDGEKILAYRRLNCQDWALVVEDMESEVFSDVNTLRLMLGIFFIVFNIIVVVFVLFVAKNIGGDVNNVCKFVQKLGSLDLSPDDSLSKYKDREDEIGMMSHSAESLSENLSAVVMDASDILDRLANGDLTVDTAQNSGYYYGDFASLNVSLTGIRDGLYSIICNIVESTNSVSSGANEIAAGAQALAQGATEQAASVEELSATIGVVAEKIRTNAEHSKDASKKTGIAEASIQEVTGSMKELVKAMNEVKESSAKTDKIIKTIEDIAFQTNILALNAAVEASRAGEAGKGFAVVADEVRNLAAKSAEAAQNTTSLIQNTVDAVDNSSVHVDRVAQKLNEVSEVTQQVASLNADISRDSIEAAESVGQINIGIEQISTVVQTNSATAEQSAAASETLSAQADTLRDEVGKFKL